MGAQPHFFEGLCKAMDLKMDDVVVEIIKRKPELSKDWRFMYEIKNSKENKREKKTTIQKS